MLDIRELQDAVGRWANKNFDPANGPQDMDFENRIEAMRCALGICEEAGELAHAILKRDQCIRGTFEEHNAKAQDALGDIFVYACHLAYRERWDLEQIFSTVVAKILVRDWNKDKVSGGEAEAPQELTPSGKLTPEQSTKFIAHTIELTRELEEKLIEALAQYAHDAWASWMTYLFSKCDFLGGAATINPGHTQGLRRLIGLSYAQLPEAEKRSDRQEAERMLAVIRSIATLTPGDIVDLKEKLP